MSEAAAPRSTSAAGWPRGVLGDERLAQRAAAGDSRAFAAIYRRYQADLYRYCLAIVGNAADAQDALQNTMVQALRALPGEEREIKLKPWLYRVARNEAINLLRARRETSDADTELLVSSSDVSGSIETRDRLRSLLSDLGSLPERQQSALVMRELAGLGFAEIGAALETSEATARQTVYEARLGLREMEKGREMSCAEVKRAISDADGRTLRRRDIQAHLRGCEDCRSFREGIGVRRADLAAISPLPAIAPAGVLQSVLGGAGAGTGAAGAGAGAGAAGTVAGKTLATSTVAKSLVAAALIVGGVGAADRSGLISTPLPVGGGDHAAQSGSHGDGSSAGGRGAPAHESGGGSSMGVAGGTAKGAAHGGRGPNGGAGSENGAGAKGAPGASGELPPASAHGQETAESHGGGKANAHTHAGGNSHGSSHSHGGANGGSHANGHGNSSEHSSNAGGKGQSHAETGSSGAPSHPSTASGGGSGATHRGAPEKQSDNGAAGGLRPPQTNSEPDAATEGNRP
jgi:RNA polymerase sigma factor (sigma-70 family)